MKTTKKRLLSFLLVAAFIMQFMPFAVSATPNIVRFHFDDTYVDVPVTIGQPINSALIPIPATRYGSIGTPGQVFMGWFTEIFPMMHFVDNSNRAMAFDLTQPITATMLDSNGIFHLYGSWLQFGDVNGDGSVDSVDMFLLRRYITFHQVNMIWETADITADGNVHGGHLILLRQYLALMPVILGIPAP